MQAQDGLADGYTYPDDGSRCGGRGYNSAGGPANHPLGPPHVCTSWYRPPPGAGYANRGSTKQSGGDRGTSWRYGEGRRPDGVPDYLAREPDTGHRANPNGGQGQAG